VHSIKLHIKDTKTPFAVLFTCIYVGSRKRKILHSFALESSSSSSSSVLNVVVE
jgi:hypothetical protein